MVAACQGAPNPPSSTLGTEADRLPRSRGRARTALRVGRGSSPSRSRACTRIDGEIRKCLNSLADRLPFVGRSGKFLRERIKEIGLTEDNIFITSPGHYLPLRGTPSMETILHGSTHLVTQLEIIDPRIVVLLGNTACIALLDSKKEILREHGKVIEKNGRIHLITFHPAYAMRFPEGKKLFP